MKDNEREMATTPGGLLRQAIQSGAGVEILERLLALQERWEANQAKKAFDAAMAELRPDLPEILKTRTVDYQSPRGHVYYKYEDLQTVTEALSPVMAKYGLAFRWRTESKTPADVSVTCVVSHRDGHCEETTLTATHDHSGNKNDIQAIGSAVTYLQRYTLKAALGVAASSDDDGDKGGGEQPPPTPAHPPTNPDPPPNPLRGLVQQIAVKSGMTKNGNEWVRYGIKVNGCFYNTFDAGFSTLAKKAETEGSEVIITWTQEGQWRTVESIALVQEDKDAPRPDHRPKSSGR